MLIILHIVYIKGENINMKIFSIPRNNIAITSLHQEIVFYAGGDFNYNPINRKQTSEGRKYVTPDGRAVASVTTILDKTKPEEKKQALNEWRKRVGVENAQKITTEAANRGTRMHTYLEHYVKTGTHKERGSNPFSWPSHVMAEEIINQGLVNVQEFWGIEVPLYFPKVYAGTTDGAGIHLNEEAILDYKQTNKPKRREWICGDRCDRRLDRRVAVCTVVHNAVDVGNPSIVRRDSVPISTVPLVQCARARI